jgi:hypothetical protein
MVIFNNVIDNHIGLVCRNLMFPVMMLLNPAPTYEVLSFGEIAQERKTLEWIQGPLGEMDLTLAEVIILDIYTLLGDHRIRTMNEENRELTMNEAYGVQ